MRSYKLTLAYDGARFAGWQYQPDRRTVQAVLEKALEQICGARTPAVASGRTDAGVHALGQVVSIQADVRLPPETFRRALNANLPPDAAVLAVEAAPDGFHAIRDAVSKRYRYLIHDDEIPDVFARPYVWHVPRRLDAAAMARAAAPLVGKHDFSSFEASGAKRLTSVRTVLDLVVERREAYGGQRLTIEIEADGFLYNMVRNIVGVLVKVGRGPRGENWPAEVLAARSRAAAANTAPPQGLFLVSVTYPF